MSNLKAEGTERSDRDYTTAFTVNRTPEEAFAAINNPRGWWSKDIEGTTDKVRSVFKYRYEDVHRSKVQVTQLVPGKKVVWTVLDNFFNFTKDKTEWKGTKIVFDISRKNDKTEVRFTHVGLVPHYECYDVCSDAWSSYVRGSLKSLITKGEGYPN
jgi:Activator of Hsp90 ATPase homolog 1-like protein